MIVRRRTAQRFRTFYMMIIVSLVQVMVFAEVTVVSQCSFEESGDNWTYIINTNTYNISNDVWGVVTELADIDAADDGVNFWGIRDLNNPNGGGNFYHTIRFSPTSLDGYIGIQLSFRYITFGFESTDNLRYSVEFDNGTNWNNYTYLERDSTSWNTVIISPPEGATDIRLSLEAQQNGELDCAGWDSVLLSAYPFGSTNPPTITPPILSETDATSATLSAAVSATNGASITERGFYYSTNEGFTPPEEGFKLSESGSFAAGDYTLSLTQLFPETVYYAKTFAVNNAGTSYSDQMSFRSSRLPAPHMLPASRVRQTSFDITWTEVSGASAYLLDVSTSPLFRIGDTPLFISEVADPQDDSDARYVELYNNSDQPISLDGWKLARQANGENSSVIPLSGVAMENSTFTIAYSAEVFSNRYPTARLDLAHGYITGSGNDAYFLYYNDSCIDAYGIPDEDGKNEIWEYTDSRAERVRDAGQSAPNWISLQWQITPATTSDMTPGYHLCTSPVSNDMLPGYSAKNTGSATMQTVAGLTRGTTYYYRVRAIAPTSSSSNSTVQVSATTNLAATRITLR